MIRPPADRRPSPLLVTWRVVAVVLALALASPWAAQAIAAPDQGDGSMLTPPTATRYADPSWYDVVDVELVEGEQIRVLVELGAVDGSGGLPLGITQPIIELYLDTGPGGAEELLPGSGMRMPEGDGWNVALRITGDGAWGWLADEEGQVDLAGAVALEAATLGRTVDVRTPFEAAPSARLYAISGVYDPFRPDGWRPTTRLPSPWAFSGPEWSLPVVDVFPADATARARSLEQGVLPRRASARTDLGVTLWITLMLAGLALATLGLWWRHRVPAPAPAAEAPSEAPRYTVLENPAGPGSRVSMPVAPPPRRAAKPLAGELLIGEGDFDALLTRLDAALGVPADVADAGAGVEALDTTLVADAETREHHTDREGALEHDDPAPQPTAGSSLPALPAPDAFSAYERATQDRAEEGEDDDDGRLQRSR